MKKILAVIVMLATIFGSVTMISKPVHAKEEKEYITGETYDLGTKDAYELTKGEKVEGNAKRFYVEGDIENITAKNGFVSYAVGSGNLNIMLDTEYGEKLFLPDKEQDWHIINDKTKTVDSTKLSSNIGSGSIIVQTSKDGKIWINATEDTDFYNNLNTINHRAIVEEDTNAFYKTTNVQLTNGCYYRIIVAYKLEREVDSSKILFVTKKNTEAKERIEVYQFYAYDSTVNQTETLNISDSYEFSEVYRVDSQDGFNNPELIKSDDPHNDWSVGKFYVSGYTDYRMDGDVPVFLKVPGDRASLWFNLEQDIDKCNGRTDVKINDITSGSDIGFGTPTINDFGRGALIIRKTDKQNQKERQIYTNYLEASAAVGANTRVDLFEEGDYEVALDYQLHYDKPFVFGTTTAKTFTYRIFFEFKVRNGDISLFLRDNDTKQFISNANVAEHGFYIDVANSQYLSMSIKRQVLSEGMDGLVEDTKFTAVAKEGRPYTDEGIYTVTVKNLATGDGVEKTVYVGNRDIMLAHMKTGLTLNEINEKIASGAYINESGQIIEDDQEPIEDIQISLEKSEIESENDADDKIVVENSEVKEQDNEINDANTEENNKETNLSQIVFAIVILLLAVVFVIIVIKKRSNCKEKKEADEQ